jgi:hypothetical protein
MEQPTDLPGVPVMLSVTAGFGVSASSVDCAEEYEDAEDDYDDGPDGGPEVDDVSACLQKQA